MKKSLLTFSLVLFVLFTKAQTVNDVPLKDINTEYIQIVGTSKLLSTKLLSTKLTIDIDFGQANKIFDGNDTQLKDSDGKRIVFNSMIDALNFMSANGYEFVQAYVISVANQNVYHYLMRRIKISGTAKK